MGGVPSLDHELYVEMFRDRPELARELLRRCVGLEVAGLEAEGGTVDLSQAAPVEYRADWVTVLRDERGVTAAIIVEVQLQADPRKSWTWPAYLTTLRARLECHVILLVLAPEESVARWARSSIATGHPGFVLEPLVISPSNIPWIDEATALAAPELAVISALAHRDVAIADAALDAITRLPPDKAELYWDWILAAFPEMARRAAEAHMKGYEYRSDFARGLVAQGREEGREEGLHTAVLALARAKLADLSPDDEAVIRSVTGSEALERLVLELGQAASAEDAGRTIASLRKPV